MKLALALLLALAPVSEPPSVELLEPIGELDGTGRGPDHPARWESVRLRLRLRNRLGVAVDDVRIDLSLVEGLDRRHPVPGWSFRDLSLDQGLGARTTSEHRLEHPLPALRNAPPAASIAFDVDLRSYRVRTPSLELAFSLLASSAPADQRAALRSLERGYPRDVTERLREDLVHALETAPPRAPTATDALRLLLAVRGLGSLGLASEVPLLLELPERLDAEAWGRAVLALASRMVVASRPEDPRLEVLPRWARQVSTLLLVTARDALAEATREAILSMGMDALPHLIRATGPKASAAVRARAQRLLERLGRATPTAQALSGSLEHRRAAVRALGDVGSPDAVPALVACLSGPNRVAAAARSALVRIGAAAIGPMAETLGRDDDGPTRALLTELGQRHPRALRAVARLYRLPADRRTRPSEIVASVAERRAWERRIRLETEIRDAIEMGAEGAYRTAQDRLDAVRQEAPTLYNRHADPIARIYLARAEQLLDRGDYAAAIEVLASGRAVRALPEIDMRLTDARVALARGFIQLGRLDEADRALEAAPVGTRGDVMETRVRWLEAKTQRALRLNALGEATARVAELRRLAPTRPEVRRLGRRVFLASHWLELFVAALCGLGGLGAMAIGWRRTADRRRVERLTRALDGPPPSSSDLN